MKHKFYILFFLLACFSSSFSQGPLPELNKQIIDFVNSVIGKKVGRGECWDLANEALKKVNAKWDGNFKYGKPVDPFKDSIYPGDLIQFTNVILSYQKDGRQYKEQMAQHTAIVYVVEARGVYKIVHQNTSQHGRKVGISNLNLADMTKGKTKFYQPESN